MENIIPDGHSIVNKIFLPGIYGIYVPGILYKPFLMENIDADFVLLQLRTSSGLA